MLGTVQFGLPYGVANSGRQVGRAQASAILAEAQAAGVRTLDTAVAYGESEATLGAAGLRGWEVITKLPELPQGTLDVAEWARAQLAASLDRLGLESLEGVLLHRPEQLAGPAGDALYRALLRLRSDGVARKIGVSVYGPDQLAMIPAHMKLDIVQAPWNVLDQRMTRSGCAARLREAGCEFHARSVFLQGLLLMAPATRPPQFARWGSLFTDWQRWLEAEKLSPAEACLLHALHAPDVDRVLVGVDSQAQLRQLLAIAGSGRVPPALAAELATDDIRLLNPSLWNTQ